MPVVVTDLRSSETLDTRPNLKSKQANKSEKQVLHGIGVNVTEGVVTVLIALEKNGLTSFWTKQLPKADENVDINQSFTLPLKALSLRSFNNSSLHSFVDIELLALPLVQQTWVIMHGINKPTVAVDIPAREAHKHLINHDRVSVDIHERRLIIRKAFAEVVDTIKASSFDTETTNFNSRIGGATAANVDNAPGQSVSENSLCSYVTNPNWFNGTEMKSVSHRAVAGVCIVPYKVVHLHAAINRSQAESLLRYHIAPECSSDDIVVRHQEQKETDTHRQLSQDSAATTGMPMEKRVSVVPITTSASSGSSRGSGSHKGGVDSGKYITADAVAGVVRTFNNRKLLSIDAEGGSGAGRLPEETLHSSYREKERDSVGRYQYFEATFPSSSSMESERHEMRQDVELVRPTLVDAGSDDQGPDGEENLWKEAERDYFSHSVTWSSGGDGNEDGIPGPDDDNLNSARRSDDVVANRVDKAATFSRDQPAAVPSILKETYTAKINTEQFLKGNVVADELLLSLDQRRRDSLADHGLGEKMLQSDDNLAGLINFDSGSGQDTVDGSGFDVLHEEAEGTESDSATVNYLESRNGAFVTEIGKTTAENSQKGRLEKNTEGLNSIDIPNGRRKKTVEQRSKPRKEHRKSRRNAADAKTACQGGLPLLPDNAEMKTSMMFGGRTVDMSCHCSPIRERTWRRRVGREQPIISQQQIPRLNDIGDDVNDDEEEVAVTLVKRDEGIVRKGKTAGLTKKFSEQPIKEDDPNYRSDASDDYDYSENDVDDTDAYTPPSPPSQNDLYPYLVDSAQFKNELRTAKAYLRPMIVYAITKPTLRKEGSETTSTVKDSFAYVTERLDRPIGKDKVRMQDVEDTVAINQFDDRLEQKELMLTLSASKGKINSFFQDIKNSGTMASSVNGEGANTSVTVNNDGDRSLSSVNGPFLGHRPGSSQGTSHQGLSGNESRQGKGKAEGRPYVGLNGKARDLKTDSHAQVNPYNFPAT